MEPWQIVLITLAVVAALIGVVIAIEIAVHSGSVGRSLQPRGIANRWLANADLPGEGAGPVRRPVRRGRGQLTVADCVAWPRLCVGMCKLITFDGICRPRRSDTCPRKAVGMPHNIQHLARSVDMADKSSRFVVGI